MKKFLLVWFGQAVSLLGSNLTDFALGVWIYQNTGSVTQYSLIYLFTSLPGVIFSPFAGVMVDRWNRRWIMMFSDSGSGLCTVAIAVLLFTGHLQLWHICLFSGLSSACNALQIPAFSASITLLVSQENLGRANGLVELARACAFIVGPPLAGVLLEKIKLQGIIFLDFISFLLAVITLLFVRFPHIILSETSLEGIRHWLEDLAEGWRYLASRLGLLTLLGYLSITLFCVTVASILSTPLILTYTSATMLGLIISIGSIGMFSSSLLISLWGNTRDCLKMIFSFVSLLGFSFIAFGLGKSVVLWCLASFCFYFSLPMINTFSQVILQKKVAINLQGRVFALKETILGVSMPIAYITSGLLADHVFEPLMTSNHPLGQILGRIIGLGPGKGLGLMFILLGLLIFVTTFGVYQFSRLRYIEKDLPDAVSY